MFHEGFNGECCDTLHKLSHPYLKCSFLNMGCVTILDVPGELNSYRISRRVYCTICDDLTSKLNLVTYNNGFNPCIRLQ